MAKRMNPKPKPRNYAATEATLINLRATKKRLDLLAVQLDALAARVSNLEASQPAPGPDPVAQPIAPET